MKRKLIWFVVIIMTTLGLLWLNMRDRKEPPAPIVPYWPTSPARETPVFPPPSDYPTTDSPDPPYGSR